MLRSIALLGCAVSMLLASTGAWADEGGRISGPVSAEVVKVRDGDTLEVEAHIWPGQVARVAVRLRGVDAPELKAKCDSEKTAALVARDRLTALVGTDGVTLFDISGDKYFGRVLAKVASGEEPDLAKLLLREGLVAPYDGGRRRDWCAGAPKLSSFLPDWPG
ncbi:MULTISPECIES: thermonuclease family protein [unclassified Aureimonas]|uniref:thermonuclease family protein n=1 Tax=unclassified Aureimonas TaxID=2615206 RepID=UPI0006F2A929|nr:MULTISPECIES: thermonuclease family protein [unclassified Aureimonas]KQT52594.1 hypothetical protein ASG62_15445 [Aureimonas sp. Leaf427]KQT77506.1 hypothetical protein ASG54_10965 [Aureimonas sp. Leaf460]